MLNVWWKLRWVESFLWRGLKLKESFISFVGLVALIFFSWLNLNGWILSLKNIVESRVEDEKIVLTWDDDEMESKKKQKLFRC
jgi:hypothetical protein